MSLERRSHHENSNAAQLPLSATQDEETRRLNEANQLRVDLKTETGYGSYVEYASAHEELRSALHSCFLDDLRDPPSANYKSTCFILDLSRAPDSPATFSFRCRTSSASNTLANLRHPPAQSSVQVLLWSISQTDPEMVSALGLGLRLNLPYFEAVYEKVIHPQQRRRSEGIFSLEHPNISHGYWRPFAPTYLEVDGKIMTISGHRSPNQICSVPVVLIAGSDWKIERVSEEIGDVLPIPDGAVDTTSHEIPEPPQWRQCDDEVRDYARLLQWCLPRGDESAGSSATLMFDALILLLYRSALRINAQCSQARFTYLELLDPFASRADKLWYKNILLSELYQQRLSLRRAIEDSEGDTTEFLTYIELHAMEEWLPSFTQLSKRVKGGRDAAYRLEVEIRDYLQIQAGEMGLQESRKSIQLSSIQIEESKRAKLLTVLAFIYVLLNLATSIFGMNIYQLNRSGQYLSVFLITAFVILIVTGGAWYLIEQVNSYLKWRETRLEKDDNKPTHFNLMTRINMLIWLSLSPYKFWMLRKGVWWRLLTNNSSRLCYKSTTPTHHESTPTAAEFVSDYGLPGAFSIAWQRTDYKDYVWRSSPSENGGRG